MLNAFFSSLYVWILFLIFEPLFFLLGKRKFQAPQLALDRFKNILVIRLDQIGDVVMTTPFLRELRRNVPSAHITLLVSSDTYNLMETCPYVDTVIDYEKTSSWSFWKMLKPPLRSLIFSLRHFWKNQYDAAFVPRWDVDCHQAVFTAYLSGANWRIGHSEKATPLKVWNNKGFNRLFTHTANDITLKHEVEHSLDLLCFLKGRIQDTQLELWSTEEDRHLTENILRGHNCVEPDYKIVFCPGAGEQKRLWPLSNFIEIGKWLREKYNSWIVILGGEKEIRMGAQITEVLKQKVIDVTGKLTLRQTYALLKQSHLYVGNDTGPIHMAAAADIPIVGIYCHPQLGSPLSPNAPERTGPRAKQWVTVQPNSALLPCVGECVATQPHCITQVTVDQVKEAVRSLIPANCS